MRREQVKNGSEKNIAQKFTDPRTLLMSVCAGTVSVDKAGVLYREEGFF